MSIDARFQNWPDADSSPKGSSSPAGLRNARDSVAQLIVDIREAAEHIRAPDVTLEDARATAARVIELCNHLEQFPATAARATRTLSDRRQADRRTHPCANDDALAAYSDAAAGDAVNDPRLRALSRRELQVFKLLAEGHSAADIASRLSRSSKTIHNHRTRILQKLGLKNATELVRLAMRCGLVTI